MKPPTTMIGNHKQMKKARRVTHSAASGQYILAAQAFTLQNEYAYPAIRAVWSAVETCGSEEKNKRRRKKR